jgi:MFS family permease
MRTIDSARRIRFGAYFGVVAVSAGMLMMFPLFPALQSDLDLPTSSIGFVAAAGFLATLIAEVVVAPQADKGHARLMAVLGVALVAVSLIGMAFSTEGWHLIGARAVGGFGAGLFISAASALLVRSAPDRAGELLGRFSAADIAGISLGPLLAAFALVFADPQAIFLGGALILAAAAFVVGAMFRGTAEVMEPTPALAFDLLRSRFVIGAIVLQVAVMIPVGAYDAIWPRFMTDIGSSPLLVAASYTVFAIPFILVAGWSGRLADRVGGAAAFARGILVLLVMIASYGVLTNPWVVTGVGFLESTGQALAFVGAATAMAQVVPAARAGASQGLLRAFGLVAATIASMFSGVVYAELGAMWLFFGTVGIVAVVSAVGLLLSRGWRRAAPADAAAPAAPAQVAATG